MESGRMEADDQLSLITRASEPRLRMPGPVTRPVAERGLSASNVLTANAATSTPPVQARRRYRRKADSNNDDDESVKRRCVSTACVACRRRKSKCNGDLPACAACSQTYGTECVYEPNSDLRRRGVYKTDNEGLKARDSTLHVLIQAILNWSEDDVADLVRQIRTCTSLDSVADKVVAKEQGLDDEDVESDESQAHDPPAEPRTFETQLYGRMGDLRLDDGSVRYIGGTSNLIHLLPEDIIKDVDDYSQQENPITSWSTVTDDPELVIHLLNMYFTWHYTFFTTLSKTLFYRDFLLGCPPAHVRRARLYCTPLLVNTILALGCHFTSHRGARENPDDSTTAGDHFFREAKRLMMAGDEHEKPRLSTVQALALMSVREAGCGRESKGWVYSGMSFRMACDMGLNLDSDRMAADHPVRRDELEEDVRRITFWGCFLFDKCWSNYLGRMPQLPTASITAPKFEIFPDEDAAQWSPYSDSGFTRAHAQPARTRAVALQISKLCDISNDLMRYFYNPIDMEKSKGKGTELKKLSDIHTRLETWRRELPREFEPREGGLSSVLVMHMFFQLLFIHLFRPFLKYNQATSPLPQTVSPRRLCTQAAQSISKLMRLYKRSYGMRQICNIAVYIAHSACTIHLLNLPEKNAKRDIIHGVKALEEIAESWLCARRTLGVLSELARQWQIGLPEEAAAVLSRTDAKFGSYVREHPSPTSSYNHSDVIPAGLLAAQDWQQSGMLSTMPSQHVQQAAERSVPGRSELPVARNSISLMPPQDAMSLLPLRRPSTTNTPASTNEGSHRGRDVARERAGVSPSDMFGGVEQLIRDSTDWVYRDQAQFATGFGNWTSSSDLDEPSHTSTVGPTGEPLSGRRSSTMPTSNTNVVDGPAPMHMPSSNVRRSSLAHAIENINTSYALADSHFGSNGTFSYDESEWYQ